MLHTHNVVGSIPIPPTSVDEGFRSFLKPFFVSGETWVKHFSRFCKHKKRFFILPKFEVGQRVLIIQIKHDRKIQFKNQRLFNKKIPGRIFRSFHRTSLITSKSKL